MTFLLGLLIGIFLLPSLWLTIIVIATLREVRARRTLQRRREERCGDALVLRQARRIVEGW